MDIFNSQHDLRVSVRTPHGPILDTSATAIEAEDGAGEFVVTNSGEPVLSALVPTTLVLTKRDGTVIEVTVGWGTLTAVGNQVRITASSAKVRVRRSELPIAV